MEPLPPRRDSCLASTDTPLSKLHPQPQWPRVHGASGQGLPLSSPAYLLSQPLCPKNTPNELVQNCNLAHSTSTHPCPHPNLDLPWTTRSPAPHQAPPPALISHCQRFHFHPLLQDSPTNSHLPEEGLPALTWALPTPTRPQLKH